MVMVGNQIVPGLTDGKPASLTAATYHLLRKDYGFTQVVVTDELLLAKAVKQVEPTGSKAVIAALQAGADMPLINPSKASDVATIIHAVVKAIKSGTLSEKDVDTSLERVLILKSRLNE